MIRLEPPRSVATEIDPWRAVGLSRGGLTRFVRAAQQLVGLQGAVDVLLADDRVLRRLNREFRGKDKTTDVLSFPALEAVATQHAGDLAISLETAARQAAEHGHSLRDEVRVLLLHGLLHLYGMDHEMDGGEMARREAELRVRLRLPSGLIARVEGESESKSRFAFTPASKLTGDFAAGMTTKNAKANARAKANAKAIAKEESRGKRGAR